MPNLPKFILILTKYNFIEEVFSVTINELDLKESVKGKIFLIMPYYSLEAKAPKTRRVGRAILDLEAIRLLEFQRILTYLYLKCYFVLNK